MPTVQTARGAIEVADLGTTLMHEHVFVLSTEHVQNYGDTWWDEDERVTDAVAKLNELKSLGVDSIVDPTVWGLGRYIPRIQTIAEQTDLNIIVATGLYFDDAIPHQYEFRGPGLLIDLEVDPMVTDFTKDITEGIAGTGVKAAFLKCIVEHKGMTPGAERILRACARTHRETGVPITVHTNSFVQAGRLALELFREENVDLTKVVIGHAGDSNDLDYLKELADAGCLLGMDRFGLDIYNPTDQRVATIVSLAEQGYADRMVLAHDASCYIDYFPGKDAEAAKEAFSPNWNFRHISQDVLPMLKERGVSDEQITTMLVDNPRRYFGG
jgi:phosphotriesterase-related protein